MFPYYFLVALEAGSYLLALYVGVSEAAAIVLLVHHLRGAPGARRRRHGPRGSLAAVRRRAERVVVTATPAVMVGEFVREFLGAEVAGTELWTYADGTRFTGLIRAVLVAERRKEVVERLFVGGDIRDVGFGDHESDHDFMAICKGARLLHCIQMQTEKFRIWGIFWCSCMVQIM